MRKVFINANSLFEGNVSAGDNVLAISFNAKESADEVRSAVSKHGATCEVAFVSCDEYEDVLSFSRQMRDVAALLGDGDCVFADITGIHPCSAVALFAALNYVSKVCPGLRVDTIMFGNDEVTGLAHLLAITSAATNREATDSLLRFIIG